MYINTMCTSRHVHHFISNLNNLCNLHVIFSFIIIISYKFLHHVHVMYIHTYMYMYIHVLVPIGTYMPPPPKKNA